jgi:hypothetical protein
VAWDALDLGLDERFDACIVVGIVTVLIAVVGVAAR